MEVDSPQLRVQQHTMAIDIPVASTSRVSPGIDALAEITVRPQSATVHDEATTSIRRHLHSTTPEQEDRQSSRSYSPPTPPPLSGNAQGKTRLGSETSSSSTTIPFSSKAPPLHRPITTIRNKPEQILSMFERAEYERLKVENEGLRRQAAILAQKKAVRPTDKAEDLHRLVTSLQLDAKQMQNQLANSEGQRKRLEKELKYLRSYLLQAVHPVLLPSTPSSSPKHGAQLSRPLPGIVEGMVNSVTAHPPAMPSVLLPTPQSPEGPQRRSQRTRSRSGISANEGLHISVEEEGGGITVPAVREASVDVTQGRNDVLPKRWRISSSAGSEYARFKAARLEVPRKRKQTMGDAETEHLLLACARLTRLNKVLDWHPEASSSLLPESQEERRQSSLQHASTFNATAQMHARQLHSRPEGAINVLGSPIRTTSVKREFESPLIGTSLLGAQNIFEQLDGRPPIWNESLPIASTSKTNIASTGNEQASSSSDDASRKRRASSGPAKNPRKIGRPLGSQNKTKLVPINNTAASRRRERERAQERDRHASTAPSHSAVSSNYQQAGSPGSANPMGDLLLAAERLDMPRHGSGQGLNPQFGAAAGDNDVHMVGEEDDDEDWPEPIQEEIDGEGYAPPLEGPYSHAARSKGKQLFAGLPYTPTSLEQPDMNKGSRIPVVPSANGQPPQTPAPIVIERGEIRLDGEDQPLQTPDTLRKERSGLDVLADEAASASQGSKVPKKLSQEQIQGLTSSARNLFQHLEGVEGNNHATRPMNATFEGQGIFPSSGFDTWTLPFPDEQFDSGSYYNSATVSRPPGSGLEVPPHYIDDSNAAIRQREREQQAQQQQRTIAEQLARGVDGTHPLIDPQDLQAGMTPAAALAKKSRSPYIKWTTEEDEILIKGVAQHGTKWDAVAGGLPSRSYHQCRQRWLRGLKSGDNLPKYLQYLKPAIDIAIQAYEQTRPGVKKTEQQD